MGGAAFSIDKCKVCVLNVLYAQVSPPFVRSEGGEGVCFVCAGMQKMRATIEVYLFLAKMVCVTGLLSPKSSENALVLHYSRRVLRPMGFFTRRERLCCSVLEHVLSSRIEEPPQEISAPRS